VKSGVPTRDDSLKRRLAALGDFPAQSTYSTSVHLLLLDSLRDPDRHRAAAQPGRAAEKLCENATLARPGTTRSR
jgi:hypothetical protein